MPGEVQWEEVFEVLVGAGGKVRGEGALRVLLEALWGNVYDEAFWGG